MVEKFILISVLFARKPPYFLADSIIRAAKIDDCRQCDALNIVLTGSGSAGHVILDTALIPDLQNAGCALFYVASRESFENEVHPR